MTFQEAYEKHGDTEFLNFEAVTNPRSFRPDVYAFLMLDRLVPGTCRIVSGAEHDEIYLGVDVESLNGIASDAEMVDLIRCGVRYDGETDSLAMFV